MSAYIKVISYYLPQRVFTNEELVVAVSHDEYKNLEEDFFKSLTTETAVLVDVKGMYRGKIQELKYWSL